MTRTTRRRMRAALALFVPVLAVATAATAMAVDVTGRIEVPDGYGASAAAAHEGRSRDFYWEEWNGFLEPRPHRFTPSNELAVVLTGQGQAQGDQPGPRLRNGNLHPSTLVLRVGETLQLANDDPFTYELMAEGLEGFGALPTPPGRARPLSIAQAGHWPIRDRVQQHVRGHVHAIADLVARAELRADGSYVFRGVPAGTFTVKIFHGENEVGSRPVEVVEGREIVVDPLRIAAAPRG